MPKPARFDETAVLWGDDAKPPALYCGHCKSLLWGDAAVADLYTTPKRRTRLCAHCLGLWRLHTKETP